MSLPPLDRLRLTSTGEFFPLSRKQTKKLNRAGNVEPLTQQPFQRDVDPREPWHTFRVKLKQPDDTFKDQFYQAEALWKWYKKKAEENVVPTDPLTRQPVWYEDWWELHERFDPQGNVPSWAHSLTMLDPDTAVRRPARPEAYQMPDPGPHRLWRINSDGEQVVDEEETRRAQERMERAERAERVARRLDEPVWMASDEDVDTLVGRAQEQASRMTREEVEEEVSEASRDADGAQREFNLVAEDPNPDLDRLWGLHQWATLQERRLLAHLVVQEVLRDGNAPFTQPIQDRPRFIRRRIQLRSSAANRVERIRSLQQLAAAEAQAGPPRPVRSLTTHFPADAIPLRPTRQPGENPFGGRTLAELEQELEEVSAAAAAARAETEAAAARTAEAYEAAEAYYAEAGPEAYEQWRRNWESWQSRRRIEG